MTDGWSTDPEPLSTDVQSQALYSQMDKTVIWDALIDASEHEETGSSPNLDVDDFLAFLWQRGYRVVSL